MTDTVKLVPCYLCAHPRRLVPAVTITRHMYRPDERRPGVCEECQRAHLEDNNPN